MQTRQQNRDGIAELLESKRDKLGDRFDDLVDEISAVRYEYLQKRDALPKFPVGVLDANSLEIGRLLREEGMKWLLIKQKYGI